MTSQIKSRGFDLTRRSYDAIDPAGRALFLVVGAGETREATPILGQFPGGGLPARGVTADADSIAFSRDCREIIAQVEVTLPDPTGTAELWTIELANRSATAQQVALVPYLEWVLNRPDEDRGHTQYNRLFAEMEYVPGLHAVLAWDKHAKALGYVAIDQAPAGFLTSRMDFIGRARSLRSPRALETMAFSTAGETEAHPTFDPIAALRLDLDLEPWSVADGSPPDRLRPRQGRRHRRHRPPPGDPGCGRRPARPEAEGTPLDRPRRDPARHAATILRVLRRWSDLARPDPVHPTPLRPCPVERPGPRRRADQPGVANHVERQLAAKPDHARLARHRHPRGPARGVLPLRSRNRASGSRRPTTRSTTPRRTYETDFGVDGTATYHMTRGTISTELTVFVPPDDPAGIYHLTVRNGERPAPVDPGRVLLPDRPGGAARGGGSAQDPARRQG